MKRKGVYGVCFLRERKGEKRGYLSRILWGCGKENTWLSRHTDYRDPAYLGVFILVYFPDARVIVSPVQPGGHLAPAVGLEAVGAENFQLAPGERGLGQGVHAHLSALQVGR